jgi:hypothetical protein
MGLLGPGSDVSARPRASKKIVAKRLPHPKRAQARQKAGAVRRAMRRAIKIGRGAARLPGMILCKERPEGAQPRDFLILLEDTTHETHEE